MVRVEDVVLRPEESPRGICDVLGLRDRDRALGDWARSVQDTNNADFVEAKTSRSYSRPDHKVRVGRWRENPSKEDIDRVLPIVGPIAQSFGYDLTDVRVC